MSISKMLKIIATLLLKSKENIKYDSTGVRTMNFKVCSENWTEPLGCWCYNISAYQFYDFLHIYSMHGRKNSLFPEVQIRNDNKQTIQDININVC